MKVFSFFVTVLSLPLTVPAQELDGGAVADAGAMPYADQADAGVMAYAENAPEPAVALTSRLSGVVRNAETGAPMEGARILVAGQSVEDQSDEQGRFALELPPGEHDLTILRGGFGVATMQGVAVGQDAHSYIDVPLWPESGQTLELTVTAPRFRDNSAQGSTAAMLDERRSAGSVNDVIGAEQMSKSGDSDAAGALKRVTGVTVVGGKYVYVRGLGDRYSLTLLNGSTLPSPEPERRVVPLDMFPVSMLENVVIQKTYSPDLPGELGGGAVLLTTRSFPDKLEANLQLGTRYSQGATGTAGWYGASSGPTDFLGIDGGHRALSSTVKEATADSPLVLRDMFSDKGYTPEELSRISSAMKNNWRTEKSTIAPDLVLSGGIGDSVTVGRTRLGGTISFLYDNSWDRTARHTTDYVVGANDTLQPGNDYHLDETTNTITLANVLSLGADIAENHKLRLNTLIDRITDNAARVYNGYSVDSNAELKDLRLSWIERMLIVQQVIGNHVIAPLHDLGVDWRYTFSRATRLQPDQKEVRYDLEPISQTWLLSSRSDAVSRQFTSVADSNHDLGLDLSLPFAQWTEEEAKVKVGGAVMLKQRGVDTRRFGYRGLGPMADDPSILSLPPEEIFGPDHIGTEGFVLSEITRPTDNYEAEQQTYAGFAMTDLPLGLGFRVLGGLRIEQSQQRVSTYELFNPDQVPVDARLETLDYLPAATLSYEFRGDMVVRAGYGRTLSRPDFRELSPMAFTDVVGSGEVKGNPDLKRTLISNFDVRWEWYPGDGETISFAGFSKLFDNPIETIIVPSADRIITFENAKSAKNFGLELELRKSFGFISEKIEDVYMAGNASWVYSRVVLPDEGNQTSSKRPLQGQSPYVINAQLGYDNSDIGLSASLMYNVCGHRIVEVGSLGAPDIYEQPFHQLDFVASQRLGAGFKIVLKAKNLIDLPVKLTQGSETTEIYRRGRSFAFTLAYSY